MGKQIWTINRPILHHSWLRLKATSTAAAPPVGAYIWNSDAQGGPLTPGKIFKLNTSGSKITSFLSGCDLPTGLAIDNTNSCIWCAHVSNGRIYKMNQSGSQISNFLAPCSSPYGMCFDASDCIWFVSAGIIKCKQDGTIISSFAAPCSWPTAHAWGLAIDSTGKIWHSMEWINKIFKLNTSGSKISSFASPGTGPCDLACDNNDCIWNADYADDKIYKLNQTGTKISSFTSPATYPQGLEYD